MLKRNTSSPWPRGIQGLHYTHEIAGEPNMNAPPPVGRTLPIKIESGDPVLVRFEHDGQQYLMRITLSVLAVWADPAGGRAPDGLPLFNVQMAPVSSVAKESTKDKS